MNCESLIELFSQSRLNGYTNTEEHELNLGLISAISHKIGILEIIIRNKIDALLCRKDALWLDKLPNSLVLDGGLQTRGRDSVISHQSIGFWVKVANHYKIHNQIFGTEFLDSLDFRKYFYKNKNRFNRHSNLRNYHKARAILALLQLIRNRTFHFENLYKITPRGYPRLNVKISNNRQECIYIAIQPHKIKEFLNDLLANFNEELVHYAEQGGGKGSA